MTKYYEIFAKHLLDVKNDDDYPNSIHSLSVQLLTVPSIANTLGKDSVELRIIATRLKSILLPLVGIGSSFSEDWEAVSNASEFKYPNLDISLAVCDTQHIGRVCTDIEYLVTARHAAGSFDIFGISLEQSSSFAYILDAIVMVQGMNRATRRIDAHVTYDTEGWQDMLYIALYLSTLIDHITDAYANEAQKSGSISILSKMLNLVHDRLVKWCAYEHFESVIEKERETGNRENGFKRDTRTFLGQPVPFRIVGVHAASLFHPLHWLYSRLLAQVLKLSQEITDDCKEIFQQLDSSTCVANNRIVCASDNEFLASLSSIEREILVLDVPMQFVVFVSQIQSRQWVRNGPAIHHQAMFLIGNLKRCFEDNIFLIQYGIARLGRDRIFDHLVDRFGLLTIYDTEFKLVSEERQNLNSFLNILTTILSESDLILGVSMAERIKQEIIQKLVLSPQGLTYSKIAKLISHEEIKDLLDESSQTLDSLIRSVTFVETKNQDHESCLYKLKPEFFKQVNPYSWYYSPNEREKVKNILKSQLATKLDGKRQPLIPIVPKIGTNHPLYAVMTLNQCIQFSKVLIAIGWPAVECAIDESKSKEFDELQFDYFLRLSLIAFEYVTTRSPEFVVNVCQVTSKRKTAYVTEYRDVNLLEIYLVLAAHIGSEAFKPHTSEILHIVDLIKHRFNTITTGYLCEWPTIEVQNFYRLNVVESEMHSSSGPTKDEKAAAAKARKASILAQIERDRLLFTQAHAKDFEMMSDDENDTFGAPVTDDLEDYPDLKNVPSARGVCIICQEDVKDGKKLYGISSCIQASLSVRNIKYFKRPSIKLDCMQEWNLEYDSNKKDDSPNTSIRESFDSVQGVHTSKFVSGRNENESVMTTCGHIMHHDCLNDYLRTIRNRRVPINSNPPESMFGRGYLCPLCKTIGNCLLPIVWKTEEYRINWNGSILSTGERLLNTTTLIDQWKRFDSTFSDSATLEPEAAPSSIMAKVQTVSAEEFVGFRNCIQKWLLHSLNEINPVNVGPWELNELNLIWDTLETTLSAVELNSRTVPPIMGQSFSSGQFMKVGILDCIDERTQLLLRTLSQNSILMMVERLRTNSSQLSLRSYVKEYFDRLLTPVELNSKISNSASPPLLAKSGFSNLNRVALLFCLNPSFKAEDMFGWIRLFAIFELVRSIAASLEGIFINPQGFESVLKDATISVEGPSLDFKKLVSIIGIAIDMDRHYNHDDQALYRFILVQCSNALLLFARKTVLLMYSIHGVVPPGGNLGFGNPAKTCSKLEDDSKEIDRLFAYLEIPSIPSMVNQALNDPNMSRLTRNWCYELNHSGIKYWYREHSRNYILEAYSSNEKLPMQNPSPPRLFKLPDSMEALFLVVAEFCCPSCKLSIFCLHSSCRPRNLSPMWNSSMFKVILLHG